MGGRGGTGDGSRAVESFLPSFSTSRLSVSDKFISNYLRLEMVGCIRIFWNLLVIVTCFA